MSHFILRHSKFDKAKTHVQSLATSFHGSRLVTKLVLTDWKKLGKLVGLQIWNKTITNIADKVRKI